MRRLRTYLSVLLITCLSWRAEAQTLTYQFIDPCTKVVTFFSVPATGTTVFFLGQSAQFTSADVASGAFSAWVNQVYTDYRKITPCSQQSGQVNQNLITSQIISNTVQSVVGNIMSQAQSAASGTMQSVTMSSSSSSSGGNDAASKNNKDKDGKSKNSKNDESTSTSNSSTTAESSSNSNSGVPISSSGNGGNNVSGTGSDKKADQKGEEVAATTVMNVDQQNQSDSKSNGSSGGSKKGGTNNPVIVSSDLTTAQNLDKTFTPILNLSMNQSSMTGMSSWGVTSMIWFNFKQFALSGKYTKINFSKNGKLKWIHNINLTGVYTYGNILGFVGYSGILNAGKWGITGFNTSAAATLITEDKNTFVSPSITAFYTKPFKANKRLTISPELYVISTPLIYSTKEKVTTTDRTFSAFLGSGFDYQLTRRFKFNLNYKANLSTSPDFPILSFFLVGSKINL